MLSKSHICILICKIDRPQKSDIEYAICCLSKVVVTNKRFIHSPAEKNLGLYDQALAVSESQIKVFRSGIIDKMMKDEAVANFGMKYAIWVKYPLSLFHYNYSK